MDEKKQVVGIFTLPVGMYCDVECLSAYNAIVAEKHIRIHFPQYKEPEDITPEIFMDMFVQANPLWIPPPRSNLQMDTREFITQYIPQCDLHELLFDRPKLRKQVMNEFRRRM